MNKQLVVNEEKAMMAEVGQGIIDNAKLQWRVWIERNKELIFNLRDKLCDKVPAAAAAPAGGVSKKTKNNQQQQIPKITTTTTSTNNNTVANKNNGASKNAGKAVRLSIRQSRRITLKGAKDQDDIELSCILPRGPLNLDGGDEDEENEGQDESLASHVSLAALGKEDLLKMRDALKKAQMQADELLSKYGI